MYGYLGLEIVFEMALMWFEMAAEGDHIISRNGGLESPTSTATWV